MSSEPEAAARGATSRRTLFAAAGVIGAGAVLAACGGDGTEDVTGSGPPPRSEGGTPDPGTGSGNGDDGGEGEEPAVLASVGDVEVGGGLIVAAENVVVTQPSGGEFRAFTATCTHQGCQVSSVRDGVINCPCHGSQYSIEDGSVVRAAPGLSLDTQDPLAEVAVTVDGGSIVRA